MVDIVCMFLEVSTALPAFEERTLRSPSGGGWTQFGGKEVLDADVCLSVSFAIGKELCHCNSRKLVLSIRDSDALQE